VLVGGRIGGGVLEVEIGAQDTGRNDARDITRTTRLRTHTSPHSRRRIPQLAACVLAAGADVIGSDTLSLRSNGRSLAYERGWPGAMDRCGGGSCH
jgi:hypothetical protein